MKYVLAVFTGFLLFSCVSNTHFLDDTVWLNGNWEREYNGVIQMENWQKNESGFTGQNLFIGSDTNLMHTYEIKIENNSWILVKSVPETDFSFTYDLFSFNTDSLVFKNVESVWPQIVTYKKISPNKMELMVGGQDGNIQKNAAFVFSKKD